MKLLSLQKHDNKAVEKRPINDLLWYKQKTTSKFNNNDRLIFEY